MIDLGCAIDWANGAGDFMSWTDAIKDVLGGSLSHVEGELINRVLGADGLQSILAKLQGAGLGDAVQSWANAQHPNIPVTADQLRSALGNEHVQQIAASLGLPVDKVLAILAQVLPHAAEHAATVNDRSPSQLPSE